MLRSIAKRMACFLAAAVWLLAAPAHAQETTIPVRVGVHKEYTRIVFDMPKLTAYRPVQGANGISVSIEAKGKAKIAAEKSTLVKSLSAAAAADGTLKLDIATVQGVTFKHYRIARKIVIDIYPPGGKPPEAKLQEKKPEEKKVAEAKPPEAKPAVAPVPATVPSVTPPAPAAETSAVPPPPSEAQLQPPAAAGTPATTAPMAAPAPEVAPAPVTPAVAAEEETDEGEQTVITLSSLSPMKIAVFERSDALWIVTDSTAASGAPPVVSGTLAQFISAPKALKFDGGTAFRYTFPKKLYPHVSKQSLSWQVTLTGRPAKPAPRTDIRVEFDRTSRKAKMLVPMEGAGKALKFEDPFVGDQLFIVPVNAPERTVQDVRRLADLEFLPAATGMVVRPLRDGILANTVRDFVFLTSAAGLTVTPEGFGATVLVGEVDAESDDDNNRFFDFPNWRQGGVDKLHENKQRLQREIAAAETPEERAGLLIKLAILYFANNFGQEALGVLELALKENPTLDKNPDFLAVRGAASAMSGQYAEALRDLTTPAIQQNPEVKLWIGFAAAATEQWRMAERSFPRSNRLLLQYPENISIPFTIYMSESALHLGHTDTARKLLDSIGAGAEALEPRYRAAMGYLRGEIFSQEGKFDQAISTWTPVARGLDRLYHAKASLALARLELQQKKITSVEAIEKVDSLRFAWRGDGLEVAILYALGSLRTENGHILAGLQDMKAAADLATFLRDEFASDIRDHMRRVFLDLFVSGVGKGTIAPLEAVSVYNEFNLLVPPGPERIAAALNFADYLITMDLLPRAAELIEEQIRSGMDDARTTAIGTKLAAVYLLDARPSQAIDALRRTARSALSDKDREERALLKARAESQLGQWTAAIETLASFTSRDALRLKADVLWRAKKWSDAASAIESILPDGRRPVSEPDAGLVVNAAVAWKLAGNIEKLGEIKARYEAAMAQTAQASTFGVVTRDGGASSLADRDSMLAIAGEVDMFKGFLESYKAAAGKGS